MRDLETIIRDNKEIELNFQAGIDAHTRNNGFTCACGKHFTSRLPGYRRQCLQHIWTHSACESAILAAGVAARQSPYGVLPEHPIVLDEEPEIERLVRLGHAAIRRAS